MATIAPDPGPGASDPLESLARTYGFEGRQKECMLALASDDRNALVCGPKGSGGLRVLEALVDHVWGRDGAMIASPLTSVARRAGRDCRTVHSLFGIDPAKPADAAERVEHAANGRLRGRRLLILYAAYAMNGEMLARIDAGLRAAAGDRARPFGGLRVILHGDPYMLGPMAEEHYRQEHPGLAGEPPSFERVAERSYIFESPSFAEGGFAGNVWLLDARDDGGDPLRRALPHLRRGYLSPASVALLMSRGPDAGVFEARNPHVRILPSRADADRANDDLLDAEAAALGATIHAFDARDERFEVREHDAMEIERFLETDCPLPRRVRLCDGALVAAAVTFSSPGDMASIGISRVLHAGTTGVVEEIQRNPETGSFAIRVAFAGGVGSARFAATATREKAVREIVWETERGPDGKERLAERDVARVVARRRQVPLVVSYAKYLAGAVTDRFEAAAVRLPAGFKGWPGAAIASLAAVDGVGGLFLEELEASAFRVDERVRSFAASIGMAPPPTGRGAPEHPRACDCGPERPARCEIDRTANRVRFSCGRPRSGPVDRCGYREEVRIDAADGEGEGQVGDFARNLNPEQRAALDAILRGENVFITGAGGVGKSFLLARACGALRRRGVHVFVGASSGTAAHLIGGRTIASILGFGVASGAEAIAQRVEACARRRLAEYAEDEERERCRHATPIAIAWDEVSMSGIDQIEGVDAGLRRAFSTDRPFGGVQLIFMGDLLQLPPVKGVSIAHALPGSGLCERFAVRTHFLVRPVRHADPRTIAVMEYARRGQQTVRTIRALADRSVPYDPSRHNGARATCIYGLKERVDAHNREELQRLDPATERVLVAEDEITALGEATHGRAELIERLGEEYPTIPASLAIRNGAVVMTRVNDGSGRFVNGTVGEVCGVEVRGGRVESVRVRVRPPRGPARIVSVRRVKFRVEEDRSEGRWGRVTVAVRKQFPLTLAWAITGHKIQGATVERAIVSLSKGDCFEEGLLYTMISRVRNLEHLFVREFDPVSVFCDPEALAFYERQGLPALPTFEGYDPPRCDCPCSPPHRPAPMRWRIDTASGWPYAVCAKRYASELQRYKEGLSGPPQSPLTGCAARRFTNLFRLPVPPPKTSNPRRARDGGSDAASSTPPRAVRRRGAVEPPGP